MNIIGGLSDQIELLVWPYINTGLFSLNPALASYSNYSEAFFHLTNPLQTNQPILWAFISVFLTLLGKNAYNLFITLTMMLNLTISYLYFKKYRFGILLSLIFTFSTFLWIHLGVHPALSQIWIIPLFFYVYNLNVSTKKRILFTSITLITSILISNYLGFYLLVYLSLKTVTSFYKKDKKNIIREFKSNSAVLLITILLTSILLWPFIRVNYLNSNTSFTEAKKVTRSLEDFISFSSRPWYLITPPVKNPILGDIGNNIILKIKETNYFLADDYFALEHQANYFGILLLIYLVVSSYHAYKSSESKRNIIIDTVIIILLMLLMLPPFFTIGGLKIYTPGWLFYKFTPMFRVTSRISIIILFLILDRMGKNINILQDKFSIKSSSALKALAIIVFTLTLVETYIPLKFQTPSNVPQVYEYLSKYNQGSKRFLVYPYSYNVEAMYFLPEHKQILLNMRGYDLNNLNMKDVTESLLKQNMLQKDWVDATNINFIVVFKDSKYPETQQILNNKNATLEKEFDESFLYKIKR